MKITYAIEGEKVAVALIGELDTPATVDIQPQVDKLLELCSKQVEIDCAELSYIASSGLRQLITIHKKCKAMGGHMKLLHVTPNAMEIFAVTHFDRIFDIAI